jgi:hypothetical protein
MEGPADPLMPTKADVELCGTQAPDFTLPDQDGTPRSLSALRGYIVALYFYENVRNLVLSVRLARINGPLKIID